MADRDDERTARRERAARERLNTPGRQRRRIPGPRLDSDSFGQFAEAFARFMGTPQFLLWMTVLIIAWLLWNTLAPAPLRFDPFPFIFLTLMLSLQASYAAPLILLAQNRQESRDRTVADQDRREAAQSRADMDFLAREVASVRMNVGELATRDFIRRELRDAVSEQSAQGERTRKTPNDSSPPSG